MGNDSENGTCNQSSFVDPDDDPALEPEIHHWLAMYADAGDGPRDATVAGILGDVNRLLRRYRKESSAHRTDYWSRLRMLTEHMPVMLWTTDNRLRVTTVAGGGQAAVDIDPASTASLPLSVVLGTDTLSSEAVTAHARALHGQPADFEYDRRSRSYLAHIQPLSDAHGVINGTIGLAIDVTERKQAEKALARREQQLADAQRLAQVGSWEFDFATNQLSWSEEEYRISGLRSELGPPSRETILACIHPDDRARSEVVWDTAIRTGEPFEYQARIVRPDGEVRHYHSRGAVLRDASGRPNRLVGVVQDATERARSAQARALQRERQARLNGMLVAGRDLAARVARSLAAPPEAGNGKGPGLSAPSSVDEARNAATALSRIFDDIAELQRQIPSE